MRRKLDSRGAVPAHRGIHFVFQGAQQLDLKLKRQFADFVKKQRAVVGRADIAFLVARRAGKGPFGMTEELAFHQ